MRAQQRFLALAAGVACGGSVYAADVDFKVLPGAACQPRFGGDYDDILTTEEGVKNITNPGTNSGDPKAFVVCPIVCDNTSRNVAGTLTVNLLVRGSATGEPVTCHLFSRNATGTPVAKDKGSAGRAPTPTSTGAEHLILDVPFHPRGDGYYVVHCELPAGGGMVNSYQYFEFTPTDDNN